MSFKTEALKILSAYIKGFGEIPRDPSDLVDYSDGELNYSEAETIISVFHKNLNELRTGRVSYCPKTRTVSRNISNISTTSDTSDDYNSNATVSIVSNIRNSSEPEMPEYNIASVGTQSDHNNDINLDLNPNDNNERVVKQITIIHEENDEFEEQEQFSGITTKHTNQCTINENNDNYVESKYSEQSEENAEESMLSTSHSQPIALSQSHTSQIPISIATSDDPQLQHGSDIDMDWNDWLIPAIGRSVIILSVLYLVIKYCKGGKN